MTAALARNPIRGFTAAVPMIAKDGLETITQRRPRAKATLLRLVIARLTSIGLRGKIVLIDVWTYSCINWLRTLPYVRAWAEKYKNQGWVVIGVHTPEFAFEKNVDTVRRAAKNMKINYPTAIDSDQVLMLRGATASQYFHRITTARVKISGRAKQPKALPQWRWRLPEMHALP